MMHDLRLVAWLRWRELRGGAVYWLRVLGHEPAGQSLNDRLYDLYLLVLLSGWGAAMLAFALQSAAQLGRIVPAELAVALLASLPWLVWGAQALAAAAALREGPLHLTFPDMAYLAGSPVARGAVALVAWGLAAARALLLALPVAALAAVAVAQSASPDTVERSALLVVGLALPLVALTSGAAWCLGLARAASARLKRWRWLWLAPIALLPVAGVLPGAIDWPGRALALAVWGQAPAWWALALWLPLPALAALVAWLGDRVSLAEVAAESQTYARLRALGMAAWLDSGVAQRIRRQATLARRRPFLRLPVCEGTAAIAARAGLAYLRSPGLLLPLLMWGAMVAEAGSWMAGTAAYPPQWVAWLALVMIAPPDGLVDAFRADTGDPFLRQLLPAGNLRLLAAAAALPWLLLVLSALAFWLARRPALGPAVLGALGIVALACLLALCRAVGVVQVAALGRRVPYVVAAGVGAGAVALAGMEGSPLASVGVAVGVVLALGALVAHSRVAAA